jgi:hypothetical protein
MTVSPRCRRLGKSCPPRGQDLPCALAGPTRIQFYRNGLRAIRHRDRMRNNLRPAGHSNEFRVFGFGPFTQEAWRTMNPPNGMEVASEFAQISQEVRRKA